MITLADFLSVRHWVSSTATAQTPSGDAAPVSSPNIRIAAAFQLNFERRALQFESLPEETFQVAPVTRRHVLQGGAVNDDARRVRPALVGVAQLRPAVA